MTKYHDNNRRISKDPIDTPIVASYGSINDSKSYYCNYCQRRLSKIQGRSGENVAYYCDFCSIETSPDNEELRAESDITTPEGVNKVPLTSTKFVEPSVGRKRKELTGSFKVLRDKGMKFTSVTESKG